MKVFNLVDKEIDIVKEEVFLTIVRSKYKVEVAFVVIYNF